MTRLFKPIALIVLAVACTTAFGQRRGLPIAELVDVPTSIATAKTVTPEQLRAAVVAAALAAQWDVDPQADGTLLLSYFKDLNYRIVLRAFLGNGTYSLRYVSSENMSETAEARMPPTGIGQPTIEQEAQRWRTNRSTRAPEFRFAVDRKDLLIHGDYEPILYELSAGIRRHLHLL